MIFLEENRITKWLPPKDKHWLLNESIRIEKARGWICAIQERDMPLTDTKRLALFKIPESLAEDDVYYPCGCVLYIKDPDKERHFCQYHEGKPEN
jgi:hypothetical protein